MAEEINYSKLKVAELKNLCKEQKLPVSGTKQELIDRLTGKTNNSKTESGVSVDSESGHLVTESSPDSVKKKSTTKKKAPVKTILEKPVFKSIMDKERIPIVIKKNIFSNFEHMETGLVFSDQKKVIGAQYPSGEIRQLNIHDLENVYKYHFELSKDARVQDNVSDIMLKDDSEKEKRIQELIEMTNGDSKITESDDEDETE